MVRIAALVLALASFASLCGQTPAHLAPVPAESFATGHLLVVYRNSVVPRNADQIAGGAGARSATHLLRFGVSALRVEDENAATAFLLRQPEVATVLHDRLTRSHAMFYPVPARLQTAPGAAPNGSSNPVPLPSFSPAAAQPPLGIGRLPAPILLPKPAPVVPATDTYYNSPQGWAVQSSGGYGDNVPGGAATGPWNISRGAGVRIAILDSGIDQNHPDLQPNLALNLTEVDQTALPSPCDDGSPQDQQGHGSFSASLAAAAIGGGNLIGVAPQATLLNIKVLERMPATSSGTLTSQCEAGEPAGLLSWVLLGLQDALNNHANVISLSLGTLVDTSTGDGAGWQAQFNAATYAAAQEGAVVVAAAGNDRLNLSTGTLVELPAQARGVLAVEASTNPACAENLAPNSACAPGPITLASYSNTGIANAIAAPGGSYPEGPDGMQATGISGFVRGACSSGLTNTTDGLPADGHSFGCFALGHAAYVQAIGTSAAAPLVAGAAALLHAAHPNWTATQIVSALQTSATHLPNLSVPQLNLAAALTLP